MAELPVHEKLLRKRSNLSRSVRLLDYVFTQLALESDEITFEPEDLPISSRVTFEPQQRPNPNEFTVVTRKSGRRRSGKNRQTFIGSLTEENSRKVSDLGSEDSRRFLCRLSHVTVPKVKQAIYTKNAIKVLEEKCLTVLESSISEIICYGLGRFLQSKSSEYQLGFLLCLRQHYNDIPVYVYDPVFSLDEKNILMKLGLHIIARNEYAKRVVDNKTTLVYMPHCSYELTNNFLYANWGIGLTNCILLANSFYQVIEDNNLRTSFPEQYVREIRYLVDIAPYVTEIKLGNSFEYYYAFSSLSIHFFSKENLLQVPTDFWENKEEPKYLIGDYRRNLLYRRVKPNQLRRISQNKSTKDNVMLLYIMRQAHAHKETSQVLCKAREELENLGVTYLCYLKSQQMCKEIHKQYAGKGERSIKETADLVGFKLPHDPK